MKKKSFTLPFKSNFFKEQDPFHLVVVFFIIFFGTAIFFSIPTFYDYKKYNQQIENTINSEFKIKIQNLKNISFQFIPSPHLLIKKADLKIQDNEIEPISKLENIRVFISIVDLYKKDNFKIKRIVVSKANLYLNNLSLKNFIQNLKKNIVNHFIIKKSTLFFKDKKNEIILISKIKNFDYKNDFVNKKKILKINGNIFDSNYEFKYLIDYNEPHVQDTTLKLKNPNLEFSNRLYEDFNSSKIKQEGNLEIQFLNYNNSISYNIINNDIEFLNRDTKNFNFDLNGLINFHPFHFDLQIDLKKINLLDVEKLLYSIYMNKKTKYENLSGNINIIFNNINNKILKKGNLNLFFENSKILFKEKKFYLGDFALIEIGEYEYLDNIDQILQMKVKINVIDNERFNRFLFNYNKNKISEQNLYFTYQFNANTLTNFISEISNKGFKNDTAFYQFNNFQQLKILLKDENLFNLD